MAGLDGLLSKIDRAKRNARGAIAQQPTKVLAFGEDAESARNIMVAAALERGVDISGMETNGHSVTVKTSAALGVVTVPSSEIRPGIKSPPALSPAEIAEGALARIGVDDADIRPSLSVARVLERWPAAARDARGLNDHNEPQDPSDWSVPAPTNPVIGWSATVYPPLLPDDIARRIGRFRISQQMLRDDPQAVAAVLREVIVLHCESRFYDNTMRYTGLCAAFDVGKEGDVIPCYDVTVEHVEGDMVRIEFRKRREG